MRRLLTFALPAVIALAALLAWTTGVPNATTESVWRIVAAGAFVAVIPGYCLRRACRRRIRHPLEEIAHAAATSLGVEAVVAICVVAAKGTVAHFAGALLAFSLVALVAGVVRDRARHRGMPFEWSDLLIASLTLVFSVAAYRWGSRVDGLDWEVGLQMIYVRQVASGLPTSIPEMWLRPDIPLPNLFFLWEYLLGAISAIARVDPLVAAVRSRWLIPALGIPAFFLWARVAIGSTTLARRVVAVVLALVATQFINLSPDPLQALNTQRPLFSFLGTVHHSDFAVDVLLPLLLAYIWLCLRRPAAWPLTICTLLLAASFLIHPRELFQVAWYLALAAPILLILSRTRSRALARWAAAATMLGSVAAAAVIVTSLIPMARQAQAGEVQNTRAALSVLTDQKTLYVEPLLRFRLHGTSGDPVPTPNTYAWLVLAAVLLPAFWWAPRRARWLAPYFVALWWFTMSFGWTQWLLQGLTYSEILITKVRFLPVFGFVVLAVSLVLALQRTMTIVARWIGRLTALFTLTLVAAAGFFVQIVWPYLVASTTAQRLLAAAVLVTSVTLLFRARQHTRDVGLPVPSTALCFAATILLTLPVSRLEAKSFWNAIAAERARPEREFERGNLAGVSSAILDALRVTVPPRTTVTVNPDSAQMIGMYAPIYGVPIPKGQVYKESNLLVEPAAPDHSLASDLRCPDGRFTVPNAASQLGALHMLLWRSCFEAWRQLPDAERAVYPVVVLDTGAEQALVALPRR